MRQDVPAADGWADDLRRLSDLAVMAAVVETGSWSQSASVLQREPSDLRAAIARLEEEVGGKLLHDTESALRPTLLGHACVAHARWLRDRVHDLPSSLAGGPVDDLVVAASPAAGTEAGHLVTAFRERHPDVQVDLVAADGDEVVPPDADVLVLVRGEDAGPVAGPRASRDGVTLAVRHVDRISRAFVTEACDPELTDPAYRRTRVLPGDSGSGPARRRAPRGAPGAQVSTSH
ncbi:MAG: LysR family transcriptional regulator [Knoellia sp.]